MIRRAYLEEMVRGLVCHRREAALVHEIVGGGLRRQTVGDPPFWLALCDPCHREIHSHPKRWPRSRQLAHKIMRDPSRFDLDRVNHVISGGRSSPIGYDDIVEWLDIRLVG